MKTKIILIITLVGLVMASCGGKGEGIDLHMIPVSLESKNMYIDKKGKVVLDMGESETGYFSDGLATIKGADSKMGFINKKGKVVIDAGYKSVLPFSENVAWVVREGGHPEAIGTNGKVKFVLEQAHSVNSFQDGVAVFETYGDDGFTKYGVVNKSGKVIIAPQDNEIGDFTEGKAVMEDANSFKKGYIDKSGKTIINCQFDQAGDFTPKGLAVVQFGDKWGIINEKGEYVLNPQYDMIMPDGDWFVVIDKGKAGWCDKEGKYIINPQFDQLFPFGGGDLAPVCENRKWGYVNRKGVVQLPYQFDNASPFIDNEVAIVQLNGQFGLINKEGKYIVNPQYRNVNSRFAEYLYLNYIDRNTIYSDFLDIPLITSKLKEMIKDDNIDGIAYTSDIKSVMDKFGVKESAFPKKESPVQIKKGAISGDVKYSLEAFGMPWNRETKGWFPSYVFNPKYVPASYTIVMELDWRKKSKGEILLRELFNSFSTGEKLTEEIKEGQGFRVQDNFKTLYFSYNGSKVMVNVSAAPQLRTGDSSVTAVNIDGLGKYNEHIGQKYAELTDLPAFKGFEKHGGALKDGCILEVFGNSQGVFLYVTEKRTDLPDGKSETTALDFLEIKRSDLGKNLHVGWSEVKSNGVPDNNIIAIYQVDNENDLMDMEFFSKIAQAWKINAATGKFEKIDTKGISVINEGYGV